MKYTPQLLSIALLIFLAVSVSSCDDDSKDDPIEPTPQEMPSLIGNWNVTKVITVQSGVELSEEGSGTVVFNSDGTGNRNVAFSNSQNDLFLVADYP